MKINMIEIRVLLTSVLVNDSKMEIIDNFQVGKIVF